MNHSFSPITAKWPQLLQTRWQAWQDEIVPLLTQLYGHHPDFAQWVSHFLQKVGKAHRQRSAELRALDEKRLLTPDWYQRPEMMGYIAYVDRFAKTLEGVREKIPYLQELGITYLHLMPLLQPREGENDGGYAVSDYRQVDGRLGTMEQLAQLSAELRQNNISLCIDLVCNHTATEHEWARKARAGDPIYQAYYWMFDNRDLPDQYERHLRDIFPEAKQGSFVYHADIEKWVWTTFYPYQWDLNYHNPAVFGEMLDIILFLANQGVEIVRMDAVAFLWKQLGTTCENLPHAHTLLQLWRALLRLVAPATILKAEAIVAPEQVVPYFGTGVQTGKECELAYHNSLMVLLWSALAERKVTLLTRSLQKLPAMPRTAAWVTYVRCHDDIGWAITDENAAEVGLNGFWHRSFLSDFYSGQFAHSFARGSVFQFNPNTQDRRINGSCASLAGLEQGVFERDWGKVERAIGRILLIHSIILAYGGIPLLYMGDEVGLLNDYNYTEESAYANDSRWLHRPRMDWHFAQARHDPTTIPHRLFQPLRLMIHQRRQIAAFHADAPAVPLWSGNEAVFALGRHSPRGRVLLLGNFSDYDQTVTASRLSEWGYGGRLYDYLGQNVHNGAWGVTLRPLQAMWLSAE